MMEIPKEITDGGRTLSRKFLSQHIGEYNPKGNVLISAGKLEDLFSLLAYLYYSAASEDTKK